MAKQAGIIKEVHTHMLRHTYATHLLEDGVNIITVQKMMGHANIESTMVYLHSLSRGLRDLSNTRSVAH